MNITLCTYVKKRIFQTKLNIPNILNILSPDDKMIFVDYDDPEHSGEYVKSLNDSRIDIIQVKNCQYWNVSHARNIAIKHIKTDNTVVIMCDVDLIITKELISVIKDNITDSSTFFWNNNITDYGFLASSIQNYRRVNGYEEAICGYGIEDGQILKYFHKYKLNNIQHKYNGNKINTIHEGHVRCLQMTNIHESMKINQKICDVLFESFDMSNYGRNWGRTL